jgi:hypothetical protein
MVSGTIATLFASITTVAVASLTYWLTKQKEREAQLRTEKLEHYKAFVVSLTGILEGESRDQDQKAFAKACNNLLMFAPQPVLEALRGFQEESRASNPNKSRENHDRVLSELLLEIRKDLGVSPKDDPETFRAWLWGSGVNTKPSERSSHGKAGP